MKLILASQSFIRKKAMDMLGTPYEVIHSNFDEASVKESDPWCRAQRLAEEKAKVVGEDNKEALVIGSDAFMHRDGKLFEKPCSTMEAKEMLLSLSGTEFEFITGLAVYHGKEDVMLSAVDTCRITFRELNTSEIEAYVYSHPVLKCAGGFDVEGALCFSERVEGSPTITSGMSICRLVQFLQQFEVDVFAQTQLMA